MRNRVRYILIAILLMVYTDAAFCQSQTINFGSINQLFSKDILVTGLSSYSGMQATVPTEEFNGTDYSVLLKKYYCN